MFNAHNGGILGIIIALFQVLKPTYNVQKRGQVIKLQNYYLLLHEWNFIIDSINAQFP